MGLDNLSIREVRHVKRLHDKINSRTHKLSVSKSTDAKVRFLIKSEVHDVFGYKTNWKGFQVGKKHKIDEVYLPDPLGQLTILGNRK